MRLRAILGVLFFVFSGLAWASDTPTASDSTTTLQTDTPPTTAVGSEGPRRWSFVSGVGQSLGWLGGSAEVYFAKARVSVFGGAGYVRTSAEETPVYSGVGIAAGARVFTPGRRHRGFAEVAILPLHVEWWGEGRPLQFLNDRVIYGPALSVGYQFVGSSGFTFLSSIGVGHGLNDPNPKPRDAILVTTIGVGYTKRLKRPQP